MEILSRKLDSSTRCVYSYQVLRVPGLSKPVEECDRVSTAQIILFPGLTTVLTKEISDKIVESSPGTAVANA